MTLQQRSVGGLVAAVLALVLSPAASAEVISATATVWELLPNAQSKNSMFREIVDIRELQDVEDGVATATADFGSGGYGRAFFTDDGITFGNIVEAPNQNRRLIEPVLGRGGIAQTEILLKLRGTEDVASFRYVFSGFTVTVGYDPEFGPICRPGEFYCLDAGWESSVKLYKSDFDAGDILLREETFGARVQTDGLGGFEAFGEVPGSFVLDVVDGPYGASITTPQSENPLPGTQNVGLASVSLDGIDIDEEFLVRLTLEAWAFDRSSDAGLGRKAFAFVRDPLDPLSGVKLEFIGIESAAAVPLPATAWLLATGLAAIIARSRRWAPSRR